MPAYHDSSTETSDSRRLPPHLYAQQCPEHLPNKCFCSSVFRREVPGDMAVLRSLAGAPHFPGRFARALASEDDPLCWGRAQQPQLQTDTGCGSQGRSGPGQPHGGHRGMVCTEPRATWLGCEVQAHPVLFVATSVVLLPSSVPLECSRLLACCLSPLVSLVCLCPSAPPHSAWVSLSL